MLFNDELTGGRTRRRIDDNPGSDENDRAPATSYNRDCSSQRYNRGDNSLK